jgi:Leucine-rich repeat (LRR) protein
MHAATKSSARKNWWRYSLRAFFLFMTVVAIGTAWIGSEFERCRRENAAVAKLTERNRGGTTETLFVSRFDQNTIDPLNPPPPRQSRGIIENLQNLRLFRTAVMIRVFPKGNTFTAERDDAGRRLIKREYNSGLTDDDMASLKQLTSLRVVWLEANGITDRGLQQLSNLTQLEKLWLQSTAVTDKGVATLLNFTKLRDLDLSGTYVTDACIDALAKCPRLEYLKLGNTNVTEAGKASLRKALPNCRIEN